MFIHNTLVAEGLRDCHAYSSKVDKDKIISRKLEGSENKAGGQEGKAQGKRQKAKISHK